MKSSYYLVKSYICDMRAWFQFPAIFKNRMLFWEVRGDKSKFSSWRKYHFAPCSMFLYTISRLKCPYIVLKPGQTTDCDIPPPVTTRGLVCLTQFQMQFQKMQITLSMHWTLTGFVPQLFYNPNSVLEFGDWVWSTNLGIQEHNIYIHYNRTIASCGDL